MYDLHGYAFPDPVLFVSVQLAEKQHTYLQNWLKIRSTIIHKVSTLPWRDCFVSNQQWHTILTLFGKPSVDEEDIRSKLLNLLGQLVSPSKFQTQNLSNTVVLWCGQQIEPTDIMTDRVKMEIIWEIAKLNFRFELQSLNACLTSVGSSSVLETSTKEVALLDCFLLNPD